MQKGKGMLKSNRERTSVVARLLFERLSLLIPSKAQHPNIEKFSLYSEPYHL
jgi:hypothetical protein